MTTLPLSSNHHGGQKLYMESNHGLQIRILHHANNRVNPFRLTKKQDEIARNIASKVSCSVDKKNYVISISVEDQDPLICATITDTVQSRLQQFITEYRTSKARKDLEYYQKLCADAKANTRK